MFRVPERQYGERFYVTKDMMVKAIARFCGRIGHPVPKSRFERECGSRQLYGIYATLAKRGVWPWRFIHLMRDFGHDVWPVVIEEALQYSRLAIGDRPTLVGRLFTSRGEFRIIIRQTEDECLRAFGALARFPSTEPPDVLSRFERYYGGRVERVSIARDAARVA